MIYLNTPVRGYYQNGAGLARAQNKQKKQGGNDMMYLN